MRNAARAYAKQHAFDAGLLATLQAACEFNMQSDALDWAASTVMIHETLLRRHGLGGRQSDLGIRYRIREHETISNTRWIDCYASGHAASPRIEHTSKTNFSQPNPRGGRSSPQDDAWIKAIASRHLAVADLIARGIDPNAVPASATLADPCLVRMLAHLDIHPEEFLAACPPDGDFMAGKWRAAAIPPRIIEIGALMGNFTRTPGRIETLRLRLSSEASYSPPAHDRSWRVGVINVTAANLPATLRSALVGKPVTQLLDHPALSPKMIIRSVANKGKAMTCRIGDAERHVPMA